MNTSGIEERQTWSWDAAGDSYHSYSPSLQEGRLRQLPTAWHKEQRYPSESRQWEAAGGTSLCPGLNPLFELT